MPKAAKKNGGKKIFSIPTAQRNKKDGGVPKLNAPKDKRQQAAPYTKAKPAPTPNGGVRSMAALASTSNHLGDTYATAMANAVADDGTPVDASLTVRDSSAKAFMRELRKVIERSDVIIQVLDARDPEGTRSKWVEDEVRKRDAQGKKLLAVVNKIDLVPRANLDAWIKHLRHSFPTMPFKSSTQSQRQHLSQNAVPVSQVATVPGQKAVVRELPTTSSSLGAPALLDLLKQYALSTPHSALTVGVVGYPNVGKSSLINSLKRSRACGVAAMPGKTRVAQEVILDKGVKIIDCPGVVLEDFGRAHEGVENRRRQAEIMLRNCIKPELVEDPTAPVEVIIERADPALLCKLYNIPSFTDLRDLLIKIALTRGRLGKGGIPDLQGAALQILRDWNSGKIPYFTRPPAVHPANAPAPVVEGENDIAMDGDRVGEAKLLTKLSEAFSLEGLFDNLGDEAAWDGPEPEPEAEDMEEEQEIVPPQAGPSVPSAQQTRAMGAYMPPMSPGSDMSSPRSMMRDSLSPEPRDFGASRYPSAPGMSAGGSGGGAFMPAPSRPNAHASRLFTAEERAMLPATALDRQRAKQAAKKDKKRRAAAERTEGELLLGFMDMDVDHGEAEEEAELQYQQARLSGKKGRQEKKAAAAAAKRAAAPVPQVTAEAQREADFASFLANMGADESDEEL